MTTVGRVRVRQWPAPDPQRLVVLVHGYGEHSGRFGHVAEALVEDLEAVVDDLRAVVQDARGDLPVVMVTRWAG